MNLSSEAGGTALCAHERCLVKCPYGLKIVSYAINPNPPCCVLYFGQFSLRKSHAATHALRAFRSRAAPHIRQSAHAA